MFWLRKAVQLECIKKTDLPLQIVRKKGLIKVERQAAWPQNKAMPSPGFVDL